MEATLAAAACAAGLAGGRLGTGAGAGAVTTSLIGPASVSPLEAERPKFAIAGRMLPDPWAVEVWD